MYVLTPEQLEAVKAVIAKHHAALVLKIVGPEALTDGEAELVDEAKAGEILDTIRQSYLYGLAVAAGELTPETTWPEFLDWVGKNPTPLSGAQNLAVQAAQQHAGAHIRHLGAKVVQQFDMLVFQEDAQARAEALRTVRDQVAQNIARKESISSLKFELGRRLEDWTRDWHRVAVTEKVSAMNQGVADDYRAKHGDPWVYKQVMPDACRHCFTEGTMVETRSGPKPIEAIEVGDEVLTHKLRWRRVIEVIQNDYEGPIYGFNGQAPHATANHPYLVDLDWKRVDSIQEGDHVVSLVQTLNADDQPTAVTEQTLLQGVTSPGRSRVMPGSSVQLYRYLQARDANVDIVYTDSHLRNGREVLESLGQGEAIWSREAQCFLPSPGSLLTGRSGLKLGNRFMRWGDVGLGWFLDFLGFRSKTGFPYSTRLLSLFEAPKLYTRFLQCLIDGSPRLLETLRQLFGGPEFVPVETNRLVDVDGVGMMRDGFLVPSNRDAVLFQKLLQMGDGSLPLTVEGSNAHAGLVVRDDVLGRHDHCVVPSVVKVNTIRSEEYEGTVYNLEVEEDESYFANGLAVHNCLRLHLGPDGNPRLFRLSTLEANGTNVGKKAADWKPGVGPVHPHCQCVLQRVPTGWGFDEDGDLVPGGKGGIKYESEADAEKAVVLEDQLQKAFRIKDRINFQGLSISIEQRVGDTRRWTDPTGYEGETRMFFAYGFLDGTLGPDGDEYDCYVGPDPTAPFVFIVHQNDPESGEWDEDKAFLGFPNAHTAKAAYLVHYDREDFYGSMTQMTVDEFRQKVLQTRRPGSLESDGMVKATLSPHPAAYSVTGDRAVHQGTTGAQLYIGLPQPFQHLQSTQPRVQVTPDELADTATRKKQRGERLFVVRRDKEVYERVPGVSIAENVYPFDDKKEAAKLNLDAIAQIPQNRRHLESEINRRLRRVAPNVADPRRQDRAPEHPFVLNAKKRGEDLQERVARIREAFGLTEEEYEGFTNRLKKGGDTIAYRAGIAAGLTPAEADAYAKEGPGAGDPKAWKRRLKKSVPFVGPRGGLWADAEHTVPWKAREGVVPVSNELVHATVDALLDKVEAKGEHQMMRMGELDGKSTDVKLGRRKVKVWVEVGTAFEASITFPANPKLSPTITLKVPGGLKQDRASTAAALRNTLAHELTHALDPSIQKRRAAGKELQSTGGKGYSQDYVNTPAEMVAHMQEVFRDLHDKKAAARAKSGLMSKDPALWAKANSRTWKDINRDLTPENRKRAMKLIAGWWENHKAGVGQTLEKGGGPYIGPRGGKWADPQMTVPWKEGKVAPKRKKQRAEPEPEGGWKDGYPDWLPEPSFGRDAWDKEKFGKRGGTEQLHMVGGAWKPERKKLHKRIVNGFFAKGRGEREDPNAPPTVTVTMGGPGSGKSTVLRLFEMGTGAVTVNSDDVKEQLPEFGRLRKEGWRTASSAVQHESHIVMTQVLDRCLEEKLDFVYDRTGADKGDFLKEVLGFKEAGYTVNLIMPYLDPDTAVERAERRGRQTGRFVPERLTRSIHQRVPANFAAVAAVADTALLVDNSGAQPTTIFRKADGKGELLEEDLADRFAGLQDLVTQEEEVQKSVNTARRLEALYLLAVKTEAAERERFEPGQGLLVEVLSDGRNRYVLDEGG